MTVRLALALLACFMLAACTNSSTDANDKDNNNNRFGGFYGGPIGGGMP
jgi:outer membrane biogenesis lipoprotein LolB